MHLEGEIIMEENRGIVDFSVRVRISEEFLRTHNSKVWPIKKQL